MSCSRAPDISTTLKRMVGESRRSIPTLARESGVSRHKLWRWVTARTADIGLRDADKLHRTLSGRGIGQ